MTTVSIPPAADLDTVVDLEAADTCGLQRTAGGKQDQEATPCGE